MKKKRFIKKLRAYRLHRDEINKIVKHIVDKSGQLSYNDVSRDIESKIIKCIIRDLPTYPIDYTYAPIEYVEHKFSEFEMIGVNLSLRHDSTIINHPNYSIIRSVD